MNVEIWFRHMWRPSLSGWKPSLVRCRPSLLGWRPSLVETIEKLKEGPVLLYCDLPYPERKRNERGGRMPGARMVRFAADPALPVTFGSSFYSDEGHMGGMSRWAHDGSC